MCVARGELYAQAQAAPGASLTRRWLLACAAVLCLPEAGAVAAFSSSCGTGEAGSSSAAVARAEGAGSGSVRAAWSEGAFFVELAVSPAASVPMVLRRPGSSWGTSVEDLEDLWKQGRCLPIRTAL